MLYIVATPIGNLGDMSARAIETLKNVEYILCEDTRTSKVLLDYYNIDKKLVSYHKYNEKEKCDSIVKDIMAGKDVGLISDAGTPAVSDPGNVVVRALIEHDLPMTVVPGASALINAFVLSGMAAPFTFVGFLPEKSKDRRELLNKLSTSPFTSIYYVSPHKIDEFFKDMYRAFGDRRVRVARELTKKFEEVVTCNLADGYTGVTKGEFVACVEGASMTESEVTDDVIAAELANMVSSGKTKKEAVAELCTKYNLKKNYVYNISLNIG